MGALTNKQTIAFCLCLIIVFSFVTFNVEASSSTQAAIISYGAVASGSVVLGLSAAGGSAAWQPANVMVGSIFTAQSSGTANSISVYINNPTNTATKIKSAIYSESTKTLLASTQENTVNAGSIGWQTLSFTAGPTLTSGASYSLVVWISGSGNILYYNSGSTRQSWYATVSYANYPTGPYTSFAGYGQENNVYSIYCTIGSTSTSSPTPTPTPSPTPSPSPAPASASSNGQLIVYYNGQLYDGNGNPNAAATRIAQAAQTYGNPQWLVIGNGALNAGGTANIPIPSAFINYCHNHGLKVISHCHSSNDGGSTFYSEAVVEAQIDYQIAAGSNVDGFEIDEAMNTAAYYTDIGNYVKSHGYTFYALNTGRRDVSDDMAAIDTNLGLNGWVGVESAYYYFATHGGVGQTDLYSHAQPLITKYPQRFAGLTSNWYIWYYTVANPAASYIDSPNAQTFPITESQAVTLVHEAWSHGIYYYGILWDSNPNANPPSGDCSGFPSWWEDFLSQL